MSDTFIITVLSFALVLAVVASLLVWVILPALRDDEKEEDEEITLDDYIHQINSVNRSGYDFDLDQQDQIDANAAKIARIKAALAATALVNPSLLATTATTSTAGTAATAANTAASHAGVSQAALQRSPGGSDAAERGLPKATVADVGSDKVWTITDGVFKYRAKQTEKQVCTGASCYNVQS